MSYFTDKFDDNIISLLKSGAVGFMPSDTVYGLSAIALDQSAVERIYAVKQRDDNKPCIILLSDLNQLDSLGIDSKELESMSRFWPAPLTVVVNTERSPNYLHRGTHSLAVRIPNSENLRTLISKVGPIISTSANIQDEPVAHTPDHAYEVFKNQIDFYVDAGELSGDPSTVIKLDKGQIIVLRQGAWQMPDLPL